MKNPIKVRLICKKGSNVTDVTDVTAILTYFPIGNKLKYLSQASQVSQTKKLRW